MKACQWDRFFAKLKCQLRSNLSLGIKYSMVTWFVTSDYCQSRGKTRHASRNVNWALLLSPFGLRQQRIPVGNHLLDRNSCKKNFLLFSSLSFSRFFNYDFTICNVSYSYRSFGHSNRWRHKIGSRVEYLILTENILLLFTLKFEVGGGIQRYRRLSMRFNENSEVDYFLGHPTGLHANGSRTGLTCSRD